MAESLSKDYLEEDESSGFDFKKIWMMFVLHWYWFVFSAIVCLSVAFVYLRYTRPVYSTSMKVLIKDDNGKSRGGGMDLSQMGMISNTNGFDNELEILSSKSLAIRTVKTLKLYARYYAEGRLSNRELYKCSPVLVDMDESSLDRLQRLVTMEIEKAGNGVRVTINLSDSTVVTKTLDRLPATVQTPLGLFSFMPNPGFEMGNRKLYVHIYSPSMMGRMYASALSASSSSKTTTVALVSLQDTEPNRAMDYLSELLNSYNMDANEDKNEVATKTEIFINERIEAISAELGTTERNLEEYKREHGLINLKNDATAALAGSGASQEKQVEMQTQLTLAKSLLDYVDNPANALQIIPANLGISNASLNASISAYNELVLQRSRQLKSASEDSPALVPVTTQLEALWPAIRQSLASVYADLKTQKESVDKQYDMYQNRILNTPTQERMLNDIGRRQEIQAGLYLMLLQKREENAISLASMATKGRMIDAPEQFVKVAPKASMIWMIGLLVGLGLPAGILLLLDFLRYKIEGRQDVERITKLPVLADIPVAVGLPEGERSIVVRENGNDVIEESFRTLRSNLRFVMKAEDKVILCSSFIPGEGKTFVSSNLAMSQAVLGKKVLMVGMDIRKPRLARLFGLKSSDNGISSYLANGQDDENLLRQQIFPTDVHPNLFVLPAGIIPPNPTELIARPLMDKTFARLRSMFDVIIVDTPPLGLVTDTFELGRLADVSVLVCRADFTPKESLSVVDEISRSGKLPNVNIVINGIDMRKRKYGYYYGYGRYGRYGSGLYTYHFGNHREV
ncbi:MAG: polysaccharide biosynthesis tyrosine autokinase [Clostridium sp.]|nr:polysaccharide biosynthesis tyrosine autokinase [Clostridium sp.]